MDMDIDGATRVGDFVTEDSEQGHQDYQIAPKVTVIKGASLIIDIGKRKLLEQFESPSGQPAETMWSLVDLLPVDTLRAVLRDSIDFESGNFGRGWSGSFDGSIKVTVEVTARRTVWLEEEDAAD